MNCSLKALAMSGVYVCVVLECYGVVVLLWWSFVGWSMYSIPVGVCVSSLVVVVVCHDQVRLQVSQGFRCRDS